jgi:hypothetical protein
LPCGVCQSSNPDDPPRGRSRAEARSRAPWWAAAPSGDTHLPARLALRRSAWLLSPSGVCRLPITPARLVAARVPKHADNPVVSRRTAGLHPPSGQARRAPKRVACLTFRCMPVVSTSPVSRLAAFVPEHARDPSFHRRFLGRHPPFSSVRPAPKRVVDLTSWSLPVLRPRRPSSWPLARRSAFAGPESSRRSLGRHPPWGSACPAPKRLACLTSSGVCQSSDPAGPPRGCPRTEARW